MPRRILNRSLVPVDSQPAYYRLGFIAQVAMMAERFSPVDIADVHLYERDFDSEEGVTEGDAGVGEGAGVDYYLGGLVFIR